MTEQELIDRIEEFFGMKESFRSGCLDDQREVHFESPNGLPLFRIMIQESDGTHHPAGWRVNGLHCCLQNEHWHTLLHLADQINSAAGASVAD